MALVKLGGLAQDVRGSMNGTTFSRNRGGAYVKTKVSPVQPVSGFADAARAIFSALSKNWGSTLTDDQRAAWATFASTHTYVNVFGDAITLSGIAMFMAVNRPILQCGFAQISDPPVDFSAPAVLDMVPVLSSTDGVLDVAVLAPIFSVAPTVTQTLYIWLTGVIPPGRTVQKTDFKLINPPFNTIILPVTDLATMILSRLPGAYVVGTRLFARMAVLDTLTGALGVPLTAQVIITETV